MIPAFDLRRGASVLFLAILVALTSTAEAARRNKVEHPDFIKGEHIPKGATHDWNLGDSARKDPHQMHNIASDPEYADILKIMSDRLTARLKATGDPLETTGEAPWDDFKYYGRRNWKTQPE